MAGTGWVDNKFESNRLAAEDELQRASRKQEEQIASEQHLTVAWQNLISALSIDIAEWNVLKSKKHLQLRTIPGRSAIHYDGQLGWRCARVLSSVASEDNTRAQRHPL